MPAYIIVEINVTGPVGYEEYKKQAAATVAQYGGKHIVLAAPAKRWKAIGSQSASLCCNLKIWNAPRPGSIVPNMPSRAKCAIAAPRPG